MAVQVQDAGGLDYWCLHFFLHVNFSVMCKGTSLIFSFNNCSWSSYDLTIVLIETSENFVSRSSCVLIYEL